MKVYVFRTVRLSIIRSCSLYTQQNQDWTSWSCSQAVSKPVWLIPLPCAQWKTPYDGQRNCPKHVEFYSKNKFEKLVRLVGFIVSTLLNVRWPAVLLCRRVVDFSWNVVAQGDAREGKWRGNWRMECVASTLHTTLEHGVSSITNGDVHNSAASSRLNWPPRPIWPLSY